jgi:hypothetical protein
MTEYSVSLKDTVGFTSETFGPSTGATQDTLIIDEIFVFDDNKFSDTLTVNETYIGQDQLTSQLVTINETFGVPTLALTELVTFNEVFKTQQSWAFFSEYLQISETFDISTSTISYANIGQDTVTINETIGTQTEYNCTVREIVCCCEILHAEERVEYQTEDKYYYRPH